MKAVDNVLGTERQMPALCREGDNCRREEIECAWERLGAADREQILPTGPAHFESLAVRKELLSPHSGPREYSPAGGPCSR
jgi:hypothetical protein